VVLGGVLVVYGWCVGGVWVEADYSRVACMYKGGIFCYVRTSSVALPG
jgi:hypothetical protein